MITSSSARYTENDTGEEVTISAPYTWGSETIQYYLVRYSCGREYVVTARQANEHFTIITPQTVAICAVITSARPTENQRELEKSWER